MNNRKLYFLSLFLLGFVNVLICQSTSQTEHLWNADTKSYEKVRSKRNPIDRKRKNRRSTRVPSRSISNSRKIVPFHNRVWVLPKNGIKGHWGSPRKDELKNRKSQNVLFEAPVSITGYSRYPFYKEDGKSKTAPKRTLLIDKIVNKQENKIALDKSVISKFTFKGQLPGNSNIHYAKKVNLALLSFEANQNHYLVVDTLFVPVKSPSKSSLVSLQRRNRGFIKIIANCIVYESPIQLASMNMDKTDFVFSANSYLFKSPYKDLKRNELNPAPIFVNRDKNMIVHIDPFRELEKGLLNRLFVNAMLQIMSDLNATNDKWERDKLFDQFQSYRFNKVNAGILSVDRKYELEFNKVCNSFDNKYGKEKFDKARTIGNLKILVDGMVAALPKDKFNYYVLPTKANLLPVINEVTGSLDALGTITYNATSEDELALNIEAKLDFDNHDFSKASSLLYKKGLTLEKDFPCNLISIVTQPLKVNGETIGKIIPISGQIIHLEITLDQGTKSLIQLFLKPINFKLDYTFNSTGEKSSQFISLEIDPELYDGLDLGEPLESFTVLENSTLTDIIKVSSKLDPLLENEGRLNYVEVMLELKFQNKSVLRGPYRFSSYGTLGSEVAIPFFKHSDHFQVKVNGLAFYENGERNIEPFETTDRIIVLEEGIFK